MEIPVTTGGFILLLVAHYAISEDFVDPNSKISEWEGWGTRLGWWSNVVGQMEENIQKQILEALFSANGLKLNIVRYIIGATIPGDTSCGEFDLGSNVETFQDAIDGLFLEDRDFQARKILLRAKNFGADIFEAFAFSPPSWMTKSNCSKGNPADGPLHDNFDPKYANEFADYLTNVVMYYYVKHNILFTYLSPFYEPSSGKWSGESQHQEGCNMELSTIAEVIKSTHASLSEKSLTFCSLSVSGEGNFSQELATQNALVEMGVDHLYKKVGFTGLGAYGSGGYFKLSELFTLTSKRGIKLGQNNFYNYRSPPTRLPNLAQGQGIAESIVSDISRLGASSWGYPEALPTDLIEISYSNPKVENIRFTSGYYTLMHFSKYIRKGFTIINAQSTRNDVVAAYSLKDKILVIVVANWRTVTMPQTFELSAFSTLGRIATFRTSPVEAHVQIAPPVILENILTTELIPTSITTIQIFDAVAHVRPNLLRNGDFESTTLYPDVWVLEGGQRSDNGINGNYVRQGNFSGFVDSSQSELKLVQTVTVNETRIYHASGWCSTRGTGTTAWIGIGINGSLRQEKRVADNIGYQIYGVSTTARAGDRINVYVRSEQGVFTAQIDDVELH